MNELEQFQLWKQAQAKPPRGPVEIIGLLTGLIVVFVAPFLLSVTAEVVVAVCAAVVVVATITN